jgi:hypothetical protein
LVRGSMALKRTVHASVVGVIPNLHNLSVEWALLHPPRETTPQ